MRLSLIASVLIILYFYKIIFSNQNVSYYLFSTIVQGFLALVGFLGALTVFKIQLIENEAQKISAGLEESVKMYRGVIVHSYSWIEMMGECSYILDDKNSQWQIPQIKSGYEKLCKLRDEKSPIRNSMVDFSIVTFVNIFIALLGIVLSTAFISNCLYFINTVYSFITIILSFYSVINAFGVIRSSLGYSYSIKI